MIILGINAYHPDAAAVMVKDGELLWAAEEERFNRVKHSSGFPVLALQQCLKDTGISPDQIDVVAIGKDPRANVGRKVAFSLAHRPDPRLIWDRLKAFGKAARFEEDYRSAVRVLSRETSRPSSAVASGPYGSPVSRTTRTRTRFIHVEHHLAHAASSYYVSGFERAAFLTLDGLGDFSSAMWGLGKKNQLKVLGRIYFPHSAGFLYTAATQFLGFLSFGDEYKIMGLAGYGKPALAEQVRKLVRLKPGGKFELNLDYFLHHKGQAKVRWEGGSPEQDILYSPKWTELFGPARKPADSVTERDKDIAASVQKVLEEIYFHVLNHLYSVTHEPNLCLAGGVAFNSVANGKITQNTPFKNVFIQPAAGDAGTALGAAVWVYWGLTPGGQTPSKFVMEHALWGSNAADQEIESAISVFLSRNAPHVSFPHAVGGNLEYGSPTKTFGDDIKAQASGNDKIHYEKLSEDDLVQKTARALADGKVVGWFQGRMEFGPRALGNRSILADPRRTDMRDILNLKIKHREQFRPFAPAVTEEKASEYFEMDGAPSPFMLKVFPVRESKKSVIPAVTHVDGTARVQTVSQKTQPLFWKLLKAFEKETGVPVLLNTSFNENEPIVCTPGEALDCFLKTQMDVLVMGNYFLERK